MEEIIQQTAAQFNTIRAQGNFSAGIIITGGGSQINGTVEIAEKHLDLPVITGNLRDIQGLTDLAPAAEMATSVGLALYGLRHQKTQQWGQTSGNPLSRSIQHLFNWFGGHK